MTQAARLLLLSFVLLGLLSGCKVYQSLGKNPGALLHPNNKGHFFVHQPNEEWNDQQNAMIYFYRPDTLWAAQEMEAPSIYVDDKWYFNLRNASYTWLEVKPGVRHIAARRPLLLLLGFEGIGDFNLSLIADYDLEVEAGKIYYFRFSEVSKPLEANPDIESDSPLGEGDMQLVSRDYAMKEIVDTRFLKGDLIAPNHAGTDIVEDGFTADYLRRKAELEEERKDEIEKAKEEGYWRKSTNPLDPFGGHATIPLEADAKLKKLELEHKRHLHELAKKKEPSPIAKLFGAKKKMSLEEQLAPLKNDKLAYLDAIEEMRTPKAPWYKPWAKPKSKLTTAQQLELDRLEREIKAEGGESLKRKLEARPTKKKQASGFDKLFGPKKGESLEKQLEPLKEDKTAYLAAIEEMRHPKAPWYAPWSKPKSTLTTDQQLELDRLERELRADGSYIEEPKPSTPWYKPFAKAEKGPTLNQELEQDWKAKGLPVPARPKPVPKKKSSGSWFSSEPDESSIAGAGTASEEDAGEVAAGVAAGAAVTSSKPWYLFWKKGEQKLTLEQQLEAERLARKDAEGTDGEEEMAGNEEVQEKAPWYWPFAKTAEKPKGKPLNQELRDDWRKKGIEVSESRPKAVAQPQVEETPVEESPEDAERQKHFGWFAKRDPSLNEQLKSEWKSKGLPVPEEPKPQKKSSSSWFNFGASNEAEQQAAANDGETSAEGGADSAQAEEDDTPWYSFSKKKKLTLEEEIELKRLRRYRGP